MAEEIVYHTPVMLGESIEQMKLDGNCLCADLTFGGGGHRQASGLSIDLPMDEAIAKVEAALAAALEGQKSL